MATAQRQQRLEQGLEGAQRASLPSLLQEEWRQLQQRLSSKEELTAISATFGVLLFTLFVVYFVFRFFARGKKADTILIVGLSGGGKTTLFYQMRDGSTHQGTVTSMEPNDGRFILNSEAGQQQKGNKIKPVHIVDVPGHPRLKFKIDEFLPKARGIVFVVDALDFMPQLRPTAEYLYDVLSKAQVVRKKIPLLLVCNKIDKVTAHSMDFIRRQLEKEIEKLRNTRKVTSDADIGSDVMIGSLTGPFEFTQCLNKVTVCEISALHGKIGVVEHFIREYVKS